MSPRDSRCSLLVLITVFALTAAACGSSAEPDTPSEPAAGDTTVDAASCEKDQLPVLSAGELTIATDKPAYEPWFVGNDPGNGKGFESAVAYAVAEQLGFSEDEVTWVVQPFNKSYAPGPKEFDFDINQISITEKREEAVDFSDGYYDVNQALVARKDSPVAEVTSLEEMKDYKLGAQVGTTSYSYITQYIEPVSEPFTYDNTNDAKSALNAGQIDGIVLDLPTAFYVSAVEIPNSAVVGQFPSQGETEQFGLLFEEGSPLVDCVNEAIAALRDDGTLEQIQQEWLSDAVSAPVIE